LVSSCFGLEIRIAERFEGQASWRGVCEQGYWSDVGQKIKVFVILILSTFSLAQLFL
jgi:hypothetical protein